MSVLGESQFGLSEFRTGLFSNGISTRTSLPFGSSAGYNTLGGPGYPSVPLWRPTPSLPIPQYCMDIRCPCNLSRNYGNNFLDYVPSFLPPWYLKLAGEHLLYKGHSLLHETQESTNKELPTKIQKQERQKERQGLPQTLNFDKEHGVKFLSKSRCTGTQTQISSVDPELPLYMNGGRPETTLDSYAAAHHAMLVQANQLMRERGSPPRYPSLDTHDTPLNLSLSNSTLPSPNSSFSSHVPRPSVITCAPNPERGQQKLSPSVSPQSLPSPSRREVRTELCDPAIEEHFRRSLGRDYSDFVSSKSSPKTPTLPSPTAPPPQPLPQTHTEAKSQSLNATNVSITGSVDDHFAKSLGNSTWTALKAKKDPVNELFTGSVDDHFAKALGDTWLRIKAEKENGHCTNLSQQRHDTSLLSTQH